MADICYEHRLMTTATINMQLVSNRLLNFSWNRSEVTTEIINRSLESFPFLNEMNVTDRK